MKDTNQALRTIAIFALAGVGLSIFSLLHNQGLADGTACTLGEVFNCDLVNLSRYSKIFGIPVALLGILGYGFIVLTSLLLLFRPYDRGVFILLLLSSIGGLLFALYLTAIEAFVLYAWCIVCLTSQALIFSIFLMSLYVWRRLPSLELHEE